MKGGFATQRRAERFDALLSGESTGDHRDAELVTLVDAMRELPPVEARPEFVSSLRERLVAEAAAMPAADRATVERLSLHQPAVRRERRIATVLGGLAVASATTSMAVASQDALPGETLYPVKRALESAQSSLQSDESDKAATVLDHAARRLYEARTLTAEGADGAAVADALDQFSSQVGEGAALTISEYRDTRDEDGIVELRSFTATFLPELEAMSDEVPESARASLVGAVNTVQNIEAAATQACPTCGGPAALADPALVANLEDLLSAEPEALQSLARAAEDIAADADLPTPTPPPADDVTTAAPTAPVTGGDDAASPSPTLPPTDLKTDVPDAFPSADDGPIRTLLGEVKKDLEEVDKEADAEDWTLLDNNLTDGVTDTLGLSGE